MGIKHLAQCKSNTLVISLFVKYNSVNSPCFGKSALPLLTLIYPVVYRENSLIPFAQTQH